MGKKREKELRQRKPSSLPLRRSSAQQLGRLVNVLARRVRGRENDDSVDFAGARPPLQAIRCGKRLFLFDRIWGPAYSQVCILGRSDAPPAASLRFGRGGGRNPLFGHSVRADLPEWMSRAFCLLGPPHGFGRVGSHGCVRRSLKGRRTCVATLTSLPQVTLDCRTNTGHEAQLQ